MADSTGKLTLYSYYQSSAAYRVRIALYHKGLAFEYRAVDLSSGAQLEASYLRVNPMAEIPSLVFDGAVIAQSMAIFLWLDRKFRTRFLFPEDPEEMAAVVQFCESVNAGIHPVQNLKVRKELEKRFGASVEAREEWCRHWIERGFEGLEKMLARSAGRFCFGDSVTAADMFLVPQVFNARRYKVDLSHFPLIVRVDIACAELEAFQRAHPSVQPDTPKS
jgi:maleylacetoacetate isomerase/maleylpyruvate isomerase